MASSRPGADDQWLLVRLSTKLNPIVSAILRSRLHWLLSPGVALITVTGRRTGRRFTIPVGYHRVGNVVTILVGDAPSKTWWRNYRTPGPIEMLLRGRTLGGEAQVLSPSSEEFRRLAEASFGRSAAIARIFGIRYDPRRGLSVEQLRGLAAEAAIVRVTLAANRGQ